MATTYSRKDYPPVPDIRTIGIIGAGQMGGGIAQVAAAAGYEVKLTDVSSQQLDAAMERMDGLLDRQVRKGAIGQEAKRATLARVAAGTDQARSASASWSSRPPPRARS
jgi:3-hydroxybutyryl-CoA dehydrogenase